MTEDKTHELAGLALLLEEYKTVREELLYALSAQQTILSWSVGGIGVALAAGLAFATNDSARGDSTVYIVFALALALLAIGASLAWLGEMIRMERASVYLRGLERRTWSDDRQERPTKEIDETWARDGRLFFLNFVTYAGRKPSEFRQTVGFLGGAIVYVGTVAFSLTVFAVFWFRHPFSLFVHIVGAVGVASLAAAYGAIFTSQGWRLLGLSKRTAALEPGLQSQSARERIRSLLQ